MVKVRTPEVFHDDPSEARDRGHEGPDHVKDVAKDARARLRGVVPDLVPEDTPEMASLEHLKILAAALREQKLTGEKAHDDLLRQQIADLQQAVELHQAAYPGSAFLDQDGMDHIKGLRGYTVPGGVLITHGSRVAFERTPAVSA